MNGFGIKNFLVWFLFIIDFRLFLKLLFPVTYLLWIVFLTWSIFGRKLIIPSLSRLPKNLTHSIILLTIVSLLQPFFYHFRGTRPGTRKVQSCCKSTWLDLPWTTWLLKMTNEWGEIPACLWCRNHAWSETYFLYFVTNWKQMLAMIKRNSRKFESHFDCKHFTFTIY